MSKIIKTAVIGLAALLATTPGHTQPQVGRTLFFPSVFLVSDYRYQGQSLSDSEAVPQASLYAWRPDGYYGGLWLSGVDFNDPGNTSVELDTYLGRNIELAAGTLNLEVMYTAFDEQVPGPTYDFWQLKAGYSLQLGPWQATQLASWVPEASYGSGRVWRLESELRRPLAPWLDVHGQVGRRWSEQGAHRSYFGVGLTARAGRAELSLRYEGSDSGFRACGFSDNCRPGLVAGVAYHFWQ